MRLSTRTLALLAVLAVGLLLPVAGRARRSSRPPGILLVVWDTTRADRLGLYGGPHPTTPNLDRIAEKATVFTDAVTSGWWTPPAVASLFTGMFGHNHEVDYGEDTYALDLSPEAVTLAEALQAQGFRTGMFFAQDILDKPGFKQGFDVFRREVESRIPQAVLSFIDAAGDQPWFAVAYFVNPHAPYTPRPEHDLFSDKSLPPVNITVCNGSDKRPGFVPHCDVRDGKVQFTEAQWEQLRALYDGEIHQDDAALGVLWEGLESRGLADRIVFAFASDHGESFNDRGQNGVWHSAPWRHNQHVPLVVRYPGTYPARRVDTRVRVLDLYPSLLALAGVEPPTPVNGLDLLPVARGRDKEDRPNLGFSHAARAAAYYEHGRYKLWISRTQDIPRNTQLYDLQDDPLELNNLAMDRPDLVAKVRAEMDAFIQATDLGHANDQQVTPEQLEQLKALGYAE